MEWLKVTLAILLLVVVFGLIAWGVIAAVSCALSGGVWLVQAIGFNRCL